MDTTGITAAISDSARDLVELLLATRRPGTVRSFDVNFRPALHHGPSADLLRDLAKRADVVFCGLDDASIAECLAEGARLAGAALQVRGDIPEADNRELASPRDGLCDTVGSRGHHAPRAARSSDGTSHDVHRYADAGMARLLRYRVRTPTAGGDPAWTVPTGCGSRGPRGVGGGVRLVEVTLESETGQAALDAVVRSAPDGLPVGAGTVTTPARLTAAADAGARFAIAPGLDHDTVLAADRLGMPFLPGIATPTEAGQALRLGITTVKAFPASNLGPGWVRALSGPFPELRVVATAGITADTAPEFLRAGAIGIGVGSSLSADGLKDLVRAARPTP